MAWVRFGIACLIVVAAAVWTAVRFGSHEITRLSAQVSELERQHQALRDYAARLSASRRVAQLDVVRQHVDDDGRLVSTLLWQEIGENGVRGRPLALETLGELSYVEAAVIKFAGRHVGEGDEERGVSLVLFRRLFGSGQAPDDAAMLDAEARPPAAAAQPAGLHTELWRKFWQIAEDAALAEQYGVRVAQIEAPAMRLRGGQVWEVTLDAAGGLNLRCLSSP